APASSLVDVQEGAHIMYVVAGKPDSSVLVASSGGYGFLTKLSDMMSNRRAGREFMSIEEGETPIPPCMVDDAPGNYVAAISEQGRMLLFQVGELKQMAKGRGLVIMGLEQGEKLVQAIVSDRPSLIVSGIARTGKAKDVTIAAERMQHYAGHRARMGRVLPDKLKPSAIQAPPAESDA
ncbi:MAG TPA: DNA gyrase C-terminal beta-propeller domain-containing protein, partial [Burkholderiales bacterium]|nr:DNA gyrase C-terminal beta-propeller domain-containing protein [Burkholderiales bacterium]